MLLSKQIIIHICHFIYKLRPSHGQYTNSGDQLHWTRTINTNKTAIPCIRLHILIACTMFRLSQLSLFILQLPLSATVHCAHCAIALHSHRPQTATARMKRINAVRPPSVTAQPLVSSRRRLSALWPLRPHSTHHTSRIIIHDTRQQHCATLCRQITSTHPQNSVTSVAVCVCVCVSTLPPINRTLPPLSVPPPQLLSIAEHATLPREREREWDREPITH